MKHIMYLAECMFVGGICWCAFIYFFVKYI